MSEGRGGREITRREPDERADDPVLAPAASEADHRAIERFSAGPRAHMVGLTEQRGTEIVRQSGNARTGVFLALLLIASFIPIYWFYETGIPALGVDGRMVAEARRQSGGDDADLAPVTRAGTAEEPRVITLELTAALEILDAEGEPVDGMAFVPGETIRFELANTASFSHNFFIGPAGALAADETDGLPGVPVWSSGTRTLDWVVPATGRLQFACTVPGHYQPMHGDVVIQA